MDKLRQWVALTVVAVLVIIVGSWFLLISPKRTEASLVREQVVANEAQNANLRTQISVLKAQAKALPQKQAKLAAVAAKIPDNPALPTLIRALHNAADDAGVELVSMAPSKPVAVAAAGAPATGVSGAAPAAPAPVTGAAVGAGSSAGILQSISLSLNVVGGYFQIEQFFDRLESLSRALKVTQLSLAPGVNPVKVAVPGALAPKTGDLLGATISGTVYMASGRTTTATTAATVPTTGK